MVVWWMYVDLYEDGGINRWYPVGVHRHSGKGEWLDGWRNKGKSNRQGVYVCERERSVKTHEISSHFFLILGSCSPGQSGLPRVYLKRHLYQRGHQTSMLACWLFFWFIFVFYLFLQMFVSADVSATQNHAF